MKKNTKIYVTCISIIFLTFIFAFSRAQEDKNNLKTNYESYALIKDMLNDKEKLDEAEEILNNVERTFLEDPNIYLQKARLYEKMEKYEEAEKYILKIFDLRSDLENNVEILKLYANIVFLNGDHDKAKEITEKLEILENK